MAVRRSFSFEESLLYKKLQEVPAKDVLEARKVLTVSVHSSLDFAINLLCENRILSCPVLNDSDAREPLGWIDMNGAISYIASKLSERKALTADDLERFPLTTTKVGDVLHKVVTEPFITLYDSHAVSYLVELFSSGIHRAALFSRQKVAHNEFVMQEVLSYVCSQSDIVRFVSNKYSNDPEVEFMMNSNLQRLGYRNQNVATINAKQTALEAIRMLADESLSHLAVVNDKGEIVGHFSARALRSCTQERFSRLLLPVGEFIERYWEFGKSIFKVSPNDTFKELLSYFTTFKIHHAWVLENNKPIGRITLTDIMNSIKTFRLTADEVKEEYAKRFRTTLKIPGRLSVRILKAAALHEGTFGVDPFVKIKWPGALLSQSEVIRKNPNPVWNKTFNFEVVNSDILDSGIIIEVWNHNRFTTADFLGSIQFEMRWILDGFGTKLASQAYFQESFALKGGYPEQGELELEIFYEERK